MPRHPPASVVISGAPAFASASFFPLRQRYDDRRLLVHGDHYTQQEYFPMVVL
jgi:hypothetical protein